MQTDKEPQMKLSSHGLPASLDRPLWGIQVNYWFPKKLCVTSEQTGRHTIKDKKEQQVLGQKFKKQNVFRKKSW